MFLLLQLLPHWHFATQWLRWGRGGPKLYPAGTVQLPQAQATAAAILVQRKPGVPFL